MIVFTSLSISNRLRSGRKTVRRERRRLQSSCVIHRPQNSRCGPMAPIVLSTGRKQVASKSVRNWLMTFHGMAGDQKTVFLPTSKPCALASGLSLRQAFQRCHDYIFANRGGSNEAIFWEFLKIVFAKIQDERVLQQAEAGGREVERRFRIASLEERNSEEKAAPSNSVSKNYTRKCEASTRNCLASKSTKLISRRRLSPMSLRSLPTTTFCTRPLM